VGVAWEVAFTTIGSATWTGLKNQVIRLKKPPRKARSGGRHQKVALHHLIGKSYSCNIKLIRVERSAAKSA